jgi:ABC-type Fe3+-citrate transport system substrate-binding protein
MSVEYYKKLIIDYRAKIAKEREAKKRDNEHYANYIKSASTPASKAGYRKNKIDRAAYHDRQIENLKRQIESAKASLARERARK